MFKKVLLRTTAALGLMGGWAYVLVPEHIVHLRTTDAPVAGKTPQSITFPTTTPQLLAAVKEWIMPSMYLSICDAGWWKKVPRPHSLRHTRIRVESGGLASGICAAGAAFPNLVTRAMEENWRFRPLAVEIDGQGMRGWPDAKSPVESTFVLHEHRAHVSKAHPPRIHIRSGYNKTTSTYLDTVNIGELVSVDHAYVHVLDHVATWSDAGVDTIRLVVPEVSHNHDLYFFLSMMLSGAGYKLQIATAP